MFCASGNRKVRLMVSSKLLTSHHAWLQRAQVFVEHGQTVKAKQIGKANFAKITVFQNTTQLPVQVT